MSACNACGSAFEPSGDLRWELSTRGEGTWRHRCGPGRVGSKGQAPSCYVCDAPLDDLDKMLSILCQNCQPATPDKPLRVFNIGLDEAAPEIEFDDVQVTQPTAKPEYAPWLRKNPLKMSFHDMSLSYLAALAKFRS